MTITIRVSVRAAVTGTLVLLAASFMPVPVLAVDGVIEINQASVDAGSVTPGDTPGFPATISVSGSYRLTGALAVPDENTTAIEFTASNVTLDLNGFEIGGPNVCAGEVVTSCTFTNAANGLTANGQNNIEIRNGSIRGMGGNGIVLANGAGSRLINLRLVENGSRGLQLSTKELVSGCHILRNRFDGIFVGTFGTITNNVITGNGGLGIDTGAAANISENTIVLNGDDGINTGALGRIVANQIVGNNGWGINALDASTGYSLNVIQDNSDGTVNNGIEFGSNICEGDVTCP